jgi:M6 family metalloprotease-like protein
MTYQPDTPTGSSGQAKRRPFLRLAAAFFLALFVATSLGSGAAPAFAQSNSTTIEGIFTIVYGDPLPGSGGRASTVYRVTDARGVTYVLNFGVLIYSGNILRLNGENVVVKGAVQTTANRVYPVLAVQSIEKDLTKPAPPKPQITGNQRFASLMCKFSDIAAEPRNQQWFLDQLGNTRPGFNNYFLEMSFGRLNLNNSIANGWIALPQPRSFYVPNSANLDKIAEDCTAAHKAAGVNFDTIYGINIMLNGELDGAAWGGRATLDLTGTPKSWPMTWMPYYTNDRFGWLEHGILAHEMAHAFGAPHTGDSNGFQYGNSWDVVSNPQASCYANNAYPDPVAGSVDATYGCIGQHITGILKQEMGFYDPAKVYTYNNASGPQTVIIERQAQPPGANGTHLLVLIPSPTNNNISYSVEARFRTANSYDAKMRGDGVIIHRTDQSRDGNTVEKTWILPPPSAAADAERCPNPPGVCGVGTLNARWLAGATMTNAADGVTIRIDTFSSDGTATITINPGPALPPLVVTNPADAGSPTDDANTGTLTHALKTAADGQSITFNLTGGGSIINVTGSLPAPANTVTIDGGTCTDGTPGIRLNGTGVTDGTGGLTFNKRATLKNIGIYGFKNVQLGSANGGNVVSDGCVRVATEAPAP